MRHDPAIAITRALEDIRRWWAATEDPPRAITSTRRRAPGSRAPLGTEPLSLRRELQDELASLALEVARERDLHTGLQAWDVPAVAAWLTPHAEWIGAHSGDPKYTARRLHHLAHRLYVCATASHPSRVHVGPCPEYVAGDTLDDPGGPCAGIAAATVRRDDDLLPSSIVCTADPEHAWAPTEWQLLARRIDRTRQVRDWLPVLDAATATGVPAGTIRRWVARGTLPAWRATIPMLVSCADIRARTATARAGAQGGEQSAVVRFR